MTNDLQEDLLPGRMRTAAPAMGVSLLIAGLLWFAVFFLLQPIVGMEAPIDRLVFALKCCSIAVLATVLPGIEAISHERLLTDAFDPSKGAESRRLQINIRYLQNTIEQVVLFVPGLLVLAVYCDTAASMRAIIATTLVWCLARFAFWIGYHIAPPHRVGGLVGVLQSMLILLYVGVRIGFDTAGLSGAIAVIAAFAFFEGAVLMILTRR